MAQLRGTSALALATLLLLPPAAASGQVSLGQRDTFEDGTTAGWIVNLLGLGTHPAPPLNVPSDGPRGAGDGYLRLTSVGGERAGSRLTAINLGQWTGDYRAAGVNAIEADLLNLGSTDLHLRLVFAGPFGEGGPSNAAISTEAVILPAGQRWTHTVFRFGTVGSLTPFFGTVAGTLANVTEVRIMHSEELGFPPPSVIAQLGIDNITATAVPEPSSVLLVGVGALVLWGYRRRRSD